MSVKKTLTHNQRNLRRILGVVLLAAVVWGCAEVPITGRRSLHLVPESELLTLSLQQYNDVLQKSKLSTDNQKVAMVRRVGNRVAKAAESFLAETGHKDLIKDFQWQFNLIEDDKTANAWVMPGGKAAVYTGILPVTQTDAGLAVVMGHEITHATERHGTERLTRNGFERFVENSEPERPRLRDAPWRGSINVQCPDCKGALRRDAQKGAYVCTRCGVEWALPGP